ncbi:MAG: cytochrome b/b6 domain-containing protein [Pseudomonadota bacterium]
MHDRNETTVRVWDPLVRISHWTLAASCILNLSLLREADDWHIRLGYLALSVVLVRLAWGFVGTEHARFSDFVRGPRTLLKYIRQMARRQTPRHLGHNPAGGAMIVLLITLVVVLGVTGWMMGTDMFWGEIWVETVHESAANVLMACILIHVSFAVIESVRHRENLILAMISGRKRRSDKTDIRHAPPADRG